MTTSVWPASFSAATTPGRLSRDHRRPVRLVLWRSHFQPDGGVLRRTPMTGLCLWRQPPWRRLPWPCSSGSLPYSPRLPAPAIPTTPSRTHPLPVPPVPWLSVPAPPVPMSPVASYRSATTTRLLGRHIDNFGRCRLYVANLGGGCGNSGGHDLDFAVITAVGARLSSGTARSRPLHVAISTTEQDAVAQRIATCLSTASEDRRAAQCPVSGAPVEQGAVRCADGRPLSVSKSPRTLPPGSWSQRSRLAAAPL